MLYLTTVISLHLLNYLPNCFYRTIVFTIQIQNNYKIKFLHNFFVRYKIKVTPDRTLPMIHRDATRRQIYIGYEIVMLQNFSSHEVAARLNFEVELRTPKTE